jgi:hypothetical protein
LKIKLKANYPDAFSPSGGQDINHILERLVVAFVSFMPPVKSMSKAGRPIIREAVRYDEHTSVGTPRVKKVGSQFDEVISIARHKDTVCRRRIL